MGFLRSQACSPDINPLGRNVFIFMDAGRGRCFIKGARDSKGSCRKCPLSWREIYLSSSELRPRLPPTRHPI